MAAINMMSQTARRYIPADAVNGQDAKLMAWQPNATTPQMGPDTETNLDLGLRSPEGKSRSE
jgi:hypothetical protein